MTFPEQHLGHHVGPLHPELPPYEDADLYEVYARLARQYDLED